MMVTKTAAGDVTRSMMVLIVCLVQITLSMPMIKNSTTIVNAGEGVPVTLNNIVYCNHKGMIDSPNNQEWQDIIVQRRRVKPCTAIGYVFSDDQIDDLMEDYIRVKTPIPKMDHVTVCASVTADSKGIFNGTLLSYATPTNVNSLIIFGDVDPHRVNRINIFINNAGKSFGVKFLPEEVVHVCVVFNILEKWTKLYLNGEYKHKEQYDFDKDIHGGGIMLIGQEQDSLLAGFDETQAYCGEVANFFLWDRMLSNEEIGLVGRKRCGCIGDYIISLEPEFVQLNGRVRSKQVTFCPNTDRSIKLEALKPNMD